MDSFWSKLLILGIVAAIGLFFIGNVYAPQKAAQEAMADSAQQSVNAVKLGIEDTTSILSASSVKATARQYCVSGNTTEIVIQKLSGATYTYLTSTDISRSHTSPADSNLSIDSVVNDSKYYEKSVTSGEIRFTEQ
jgi:hypothetical protein